MSEPPPQTAAPTTTATTATTATTTAPSEAEILAAARAVLVTPAATKSSGSVILLVGLILFAVSAGGGGATPLHVGVVVGVILVHELGHLLGMWMFGYKDLRIFFIPFFGGAASGRKPAAPAWQQAIVLFLGPVPGVVVGGVLAIVNVAMKDPILGDVAQTMFLINLFNLIPLSPLDGGRIFELALFRRHWLLEAAFSVACVLALGGLALALGVVALGIVAVWQLLTLAPRIKFRKAVDKLRPTVGEVPIDPHAVSDGALAAFVRTAYELRGPQGLATVRALWEELATKPLRALGSILTLFVWCACVGGALVGAVAYAVAGDLSDGVALSLASDDVEARGDVVGAQKVYDERCGGARDVGTTLLDVKCRVLASAIHHKNGDTKAAIADLAPLSRVTIPAEPVGLGDALERLADLDAAAGMADDAKTHRLRAVDVYEKLGAKDQAEAAKAKAGP